MLMLFGTINIVIYLTPWRSEFQYWHIPIDAYLILSGIYLIARFVKEQE